MQIRLLGPAPASATESARSCKPGGPDFSISVSACLTSGLSDCPAAPAPSRRRGGSGGDGLDRVREERGRLFFPAPRLPSPDTQVQTRDVGPSDTFPAGPFLGEGS